MDFALAGFGIMHHSVTILSTEEKHSTGSCCPDQEYASGYVNGPESDASMVPFNNKQG